jgi:hypothetical protein
MSNWLISIEEDKEARPMKKRIKWPLLAACWAMSLCWTSALSAQVTLEVVSPRAEIPPPPSILHPSPRLSDLAGKRIGLLANIKPGAELFLTKIEELLRQKVPTATIVRLRMMKITPEQAKDLASKFDTFIHSTGD